MTDRMKELFDIARSDVPSHATRDAMWSGIQTATLGAPIAQSGAAAAKGVGILSSKLALGVALGASLTVGVAATVVAITRAMPVDATTHGVAPRTLERDAFDRDLADTRSERVEAMRPPVVITGHVSDTVELKDEPSKKDESVASAHVAPALSEHDRLAREARMVSEARGALHRGDADAALRIVRAARSQPGARLVPEELTVEAQALHALGDEAGAKRVEGDLAGRFPEQVPR